MIRSLVAVVVLIGCSPAPGPHRPGLPCTDEPPECLSDATKLICDNGTWLEYPCDGTFKMYDGGVLTGRCLLPGAPQQCIHPVPVAGDFCPATFEGKVSRCMSSSTIGECRNQAWKSCVAPNCEDFLFNGRESEGVSSSWSKTPDSGCSSI